MAWIAFDDQTHNALSTICKSPVKLEMRKGGPLEYALHTSGNSLMLFPGATAKEVLLLTIRKKIDTETATEPAPPPKQTKTPRVHYVSGGFLGLSDEVALEDAPEERQSWWKKLFD